MSIGVVDPAVLGKWIDEYGRVGKVQRRWAWWQNPDGSKGLSPWHDTQYLYRGQNRRYWSCVPSISRGIHTRGTSLSDLDSDEQIRFITALIRAHWYCQTLKSHPVFEWAESEKWSIDRMALAQHYEVPTGYIDLTESIEVALFFACCEFRNSQWQPKAQGKGILYRLDIRNIEEPIRSRIKAIGLQPFARPHAQWAWTIEMLLDETLDDLPGVQAVLFEHTSALGERLLRLFEGGSALMPVDPLWEWAVALRSSRSLPRTSATAIIEDLARDPLGIAVRDIGAFLQQIESTRGVRFENDTAHPADAAALAKISADWESRKPAFTASLKGEVILIRTPSDDEDE